MSLQRQTFRVPLLQVSVSLQNAGAGLGCSGHCPSGSQGCLWSLPQ